MVNVSRGKPNSFWHGSALRRTYRIVAISGSKNGPIHRSDNQSLASNEVFALGQQIGPDASRLLKVPIIEFLAFPHL